MAKTVAVSKQAQDSLREQVYRYYNVVADYTKLDASDPRTARVCSNHRSHKCSGGRAVYARANKVYCEPCYKRTNAARARLVAAADAHYANVLSDIRAGAVTFDNAMAALRKS